MYYETTRTMLVAQVCVAAVAMQACAGARAGDSAALRAATFAATCAACHGTAGHAEPRSTVPGLAGASADRFREAMKAFRSDRRPGTVMPQLAKGYSDEQIERLAAFFAAQTAAR